MFFRVKRTRGVDYLQLVANERHGPQVQQRVLASLGRLDDLRMSGELQRLVDAGAMLSGDGLLLVPPFSNARLELVPDSRLQEALLATLMSLPDCREVIDSFCGGDDELRRLVAAVAFGTLEDSVRDERWIGQLMRLGGQDPQVVGESVANVLGLSRAYSQGDGKEGLRFCVRVAGSRTQLLRGLVTAIVTTESGMPVAAAHWSAHLPPIKTIVDVGSQLTRRLETTNIVLVLDQSFTGNSFLSALGKVNAPFVIAVRQPSGRLGARGLASLVANDVRPPARNPNERGAPAQAPPDPQLRYVQIVDPTAAQRDWRLRTAQLERVHSTIEAMGGPAGAGPAFPRLDQARKELLEGERWDGTAIVATNLPGPPIEVARAFLAGSVAKDWEDELSDFGQRVLEHDISPRDTSAMLTGGAAVLLMGRYLRHTLLETLGGRLRRQTDWDEFRGIMQGHRSVRIHQGERSVTLAPEPPPALRAMLDALTVAGPEMPGPRRPPRRGQHGPMRRGGPRSP